MITSTDYQYWLAGFTPYLGPNFKPPPIAMAKKNLGAHMEKFKKE